MIETEILNFITQNGFAIFIAIILLWDKIKNNGKLKQVVENNNELLREIKQKI